MGSIPFLFLRLNSWTKVVDETVVEFFSTKMGIIGSGLYFENTLLNSKQWRDDEQQGGLRRDLYSGHG
jgi:hypothetical protein